MRSEAKRRCPSCGGKDTRRSLHGGMLDAFMQMFRKRAFRCRSCRRRFYSTEVEPESAISDDVDEPDEAHDHRPA